MVFFRVLKAVTVVFRTSWIDKEPGDDTLKRATPATMCSMSVSTHAVKAFKRAKSFSVSFRNT